MKLILENNDGTAVRTFRVEGDQAVVIQRTDTQRLEIHSDVTNLDDGHVAYERLGEFTRDAISRAPLAIGQRGQLRLVEEVGPVLANLHLSEGKSTSTYYKTLASVFVLMLLFLIFILNRPVEQAKLEQEIKQQLVQIVKQVRQPPKVAKTEQATTQKEPEAKPVTPTKKTASIKRMGALSVLGSLSTGKQKGGVNLGAVNTTAGPGLGGTQGSGGAQTSLYGKGLVAAPLGAGSNMQGGGGYGTKGKGGGQAGYGKLSLIGSAGSAPIPLGREAIVESGLDRDLIADTIGRNMGQVRFCYEQGLQGDPALAGRVAIGFTIGGNGQVKIAGVDSTTLNSKLVEDCIVMRLRSWKFPLPDGGVDVKVSFPFVLRRTGQG